MQVIVYNSPVASTVGWESTKYQCPSTVSLQCDVTIADLNTELTANGRPQITNAISPTLRIKICAVNNLGESCSSESNGLVYGSNLGSTPDNYIVAPSAVVISELAVRISWPTVDPNDYAIIAYEIEIEGADGNYYTTLDGCDGTSQTVVAQRSCAVPKKTLLD